MEKENKTQFPLLEFVKKSRNLDFLIPGMKVEFHYPPFSPKQGIIVDGNESANLQILFDGEITPQNCHPTWNMTYFSDSGEIIKTFKN